MPWCYLVDGAQGRGVVVQVVGVDSETRAEFDQHVSNTLLGPPLLQPRLEISQKHSATNTHMPVVSRPHRDTNETVPH